MRGRPLNVALLLCAAALQPVLAVGATLTEIAWHSSNSLFHAQLFSFRVRLRQRVDFRCFPDDQETSIIYVVNAAAAERCSLLADEATQRVAVCQPNMTNPLVSIVFRQFNPTPNSIDFRPNRDYYFITTSTGEKEGLQNRVGGLCATHNMRVKVHVTPRKIRHDGHKTTTSFLWPTAASSPSPAATSTKRESPAPPATTRSFRWIHSDDNYIVYEDYPTRATGGADSMLQSSFRQSVLLLCLSLALLRHYCRF